MKKATRLKETTAAVRFRSGGFASLFIAAIALSIYQAWLPQKASSFGSYATAIPNYSVNGCNTCHGSSGPGSATTNNAFKANFAANNHAWSATLANKDSDGDGFTDGEELQDPSGAYVLNGTNPGNSALVSNPSDAASMPPAPTMTAFMGVSANSTVSGTINLAVALSTVAGGTPVGITRVDYVFKTAGTSTVIATVSSTTAAAYGASIDTKTLGNQAFDITATCFDKRSASAGGARTASMSILNVTVGNVPQITQQPADVLVTPGNTAMFTITANNATSYQWLKNNANVTNGGHYSGATTTTLTISTASAADAALYSCVATNSAGSTTSSTATLSVGVQSSNSYVRLVSATPTNASANGASTVPPSINNTSAVGPTNRAISADGRIIVFRSNADNLVPNSNPNTIGNCWARDLKLATTQLITTSTAGNFSANKFSDTVLVSADGRYAVFNSSATDLATIVPTTQNTAHVYRRDLQGGVTIPVGVRDGVTTSGADYGTFNTNVQCISTDGRYIVFYYDGNTQFDPTKTTNNTFNYYMRDCTSNTTTLISVNSAGTGTRTTGNNVTGLAMTPDGRYCAFACDATDMGPVSSPVNQYQIYLWDRTNPNTLALVSCADGVSGSTNAAVPGNSGSFSPSISNDGRYIAFISSATNLNSNHAAGNNSVVYRRDMQTNKTEIVNQANVGTDAGTGNAFACAMSSSGQYVVYTSNDSNLVPAGDTNGFTDIFRRDMNDGTTSKNIIVSSPNGQNVFTNTGASQNPRISDDGRYVVFESDATDFVGAVDTNGTTDVFRRDCQTQKTILLSIKTDLSGASASFSNNPFLSGNGLTAMFLGNGSDLAPNDLNGTTDVFAATFNVAPTLTPLQNANVALGQVFTQNGSFVDPNGPDTFTATVDYGDGSGVQTLTVSANNTFVLNYTYSKTGSYTVRVSVTDSANGVGMSTATVLVTTLSAAPVLTSSANPVGFASPLTFTATVAKLAGLSAPTGIVTFNDNGAPIGSAPLATVAGVQTASFTISTLAAATHPITAVYSGDSNYSPNTSVVLSQVVSPSIPTITSATSATLAIGAPFTYQITATGSQPISYSVSGLPAGLTFDTDTISGSVSSGGMVSIKLTATNPVGSSFSNLLITIPRPATGDNAPVITSQPAVMPNPVNVGDTATFTAAASDPDNDFVAILWDFGDGTTGAGSPTTHVYSAPGVYNVTLTASDSILTATAATSVVVSKATSSGGSGTAFTATKGTLGFNFAKPNLDVLTLSGVLPLGKGFKPAGKSVQVAIGNYSKSFSFDAKGASALKLTATKAKDGSFTSDTAKFTLTLMKQSIYSGTASLGFVNDTGKASVTVSGVKVFIIIDGNAYFATLNASYKATKGKGGTAKLTP